MRATLVLTDTSASFAMQCQTCGTLCQERATSRPDKRRNLASVECDKCGAAWLLEVLVRPVRQGSIKAPSQPQSKCGTNSGYVRHLQRGQEPCPDCRKAHAEYQRGVRTQKAAAA